MTPTPTPTPTRQSSPLDEGTALIYSILAALGELQRHPDEITNADLLALLRTVDAHVYEIVDAHIDEGAR